MTVNNDFTTIRISRDTRKRLGKWATKDDEWNDVVIKILDEVENRD